MAAAMMGAAQGDTYADIVKLKRQYEDASTLKTEERDEQREARLYYHGSQWTAKQLKTLKERGQPATITPIFARKINGFVGLLERLRRDPKAYPRTPKEEDGAELCTAALRYALDEQEWEAKSAIVSGHAAIDGIGGVELSLEPGDSGIEGDYDIGVDYIEPDTFYYDPRSFRPDFSDARFMGIAKWIDLDTAKRTFPDKAAELDNLMGSGDSMALSQDRDQKWTNTVQKHVFIVEHWYRVGDAWMWCFFCDTLELARGRSFLQDEKGRDECRFIMWSSFVDQDGDRYSFHRNMKSLVDEINQRNSKALHLLAMRRIKMEQGAVEDVETLRKEAVRPDGVIVVNPGLQLEFEDAKTLADMQAQLAMKEAARTELENFGPNPALVGQTKATSGRDRELMQQAGLAELGPFLAAHRGWKLRVYRAVWNAIRSFWIAERWIRVTDDEGQQQPVQINGLEIDPLTGMQMKVNSIGALDVDIIIDEGPDVVNLMADALEILQGRNDVPPDVIFELMPLPASQKKKILGMFEQMRQPNPIQVQGAQIELAQGAAKVKETEANTVLKLSQANAAQAPQMGEAGPTPVETLETMAKVEETRANTVLKYAQAEKTAMDTRLAPAQMQQQAEVARQRAQQPARSN